LTGIKAIALENVVKFDFQFLANRVTSLKAQQIRSKCQYSTNFVNFFNFHSVFLSQSLF